ncbi:MAG TPA: cytochrome c [Longimicrobiaceae bacterium]|nr:cytochrome c [Longimicrobiaceae bacterium]
MRERNAAAVAVLVMSLVLAACGGDDPNTGAAEPDNPLPGSGAAPATQQPAAATPQVDAASLPEGVTAEMVAQGRQIFVAPPGTCYTCHGPDATGTPLAPDLTDDEWINISGEYEEIVELVHTGVPTPVSHPAPMPPMGGASLTDEQVNAVAAYVYSLSHS